MQLTLVACLKRLAHDVDVSCAVAAAAKKIGQSVQSRQKTGRVETSTHKVCSHPPSVFSTRTSTIVLPSGSCVGFTKSVAPIDRAHSSLAGFVSTAMICFALRTRHP